MKIEMSESLVASWLKHVKHCIVVNTNWKASPYWTPAIPDEEINKIYHKAAAYFDERQFPILDCSDDQEDDANVEDVADEITFADWQGMLLQTECDAVGLAYSRDRGNVSVYAVESAFHRNGVQYSKRKKAWKLLKLKRAKVTAWNIALKMFKNALSMYRWYGVQDVHAVFVAPMSKEPVEEEILKACDFVRDFYKSQDLGFDFEFYFEHATASGSFAEHVKSPVDLAATIVDDTAELYLRGHVLDGGIYGIDGLMLDKARRLLSCENLDELTGLYLDAPAKVLEAVELIKNKMITVADSAKEYPKQKSLFDRCHRTLRAYYAALHGLKDAPTLNDLRNADDGQRSVDQNGADHGDGDVGGKHERSDIEIVLDPADAEVFKQQLLQTHLARRTRVFADGRAPLVDEWRADSLTPKSNLMGNIRSSSVYRKSKQDGVVRLEFSIGRR